MRISIYILHFIYMHTLTAKHLDVAILLSKVWHMVYHCMHEGDTVLNNSILCNVPYSLSGLLEVITP